MSSPAAPAAVAAEGAFEPAKRRRVPLPGVIAVAVGVYYWLIWLLVTVLVLAQLLGVIWNTTTMKNPIVYGQSPLSGAYSIPGSNDEPYSDRLVVCLRQGRVYNPAQLNEALKAETTEIIDTNGSSISGYRVVKRSKIDFNSAIYDQFANMCDEFDRTLDGMVHVCSQLGYNVSRDGLKIVNGVDSATTHYIQDALPVLILPVGDQYLYSRFALPTWDGSACVFRVRGTYYDATASFTIMYSVNRSVREERTSAWLGRPGGVWRNGWYEDKDGQRWYSDVVSEYDTPLSIGRSTFDANTGQRIDCSSFSDRCIPVSAGATRWGSKIYLDEIHTDMVSVAISNGSRYGLFLYSATRVQTVTSKYDLETFVSNSSILLLLFRWMVVMLTLQKSYFQGDNQWENAGVGCLACSQTFMLLPLALLPRLKTTLMAFFSLGCSFEGTQKVFVEAWFVMYPAIAEFVVLFFSLLNLVAMWSRRRMSDALFGPTLLFFCFMHYMRLELAQSGWLEGFDGRIATVITSDTFEQLSWTDFLTSDVALRANGNVWSMFVVKLSVLGLNLLSMMAFSSSTSAHGKTARTVPMCSIERVLSMRACWSGGLGPPTMYTTISNRTSSGRVVIGVRGYELLRLGYVRLGRRSLVPLAQWYLFILFTLTPRVRRHFNYRILVLPLCLRKEARSEGVDAARLCRADDAWLSDVPFWQLSSGPVG